jgi:hypothetical protein
VLLNVKNVVGIASDGRVICSLNGNVVALVPSDERLLEKRAQQKRLFEELGMVYTEEGMEILYGPDWRETEPHPDSYAVGAISDSAARPKWWSKWVRKR